MIKEVVPGSRGRVLVAEDQDMLRNTLSRLLGMEGFEVVATSNGARALSAVLGATKPFDLALLDVNMPEIDGFSLLEKIRKTPAVADLPVIMLTGHVDSASVMRGMQLKVNEYLVKPYKIADLMDRINRCLPAKARL